MTDEKIIELAEKTREDKYCKKYICKERGKRYCSLDCVFSDGDYGCRPQEYYTSFLDGFKAAIEFVKSKASDVQKWYENNNDISYEEGGKDALIDLLEAIER